MERRGYDAALREVRKESTITDLAFNWGQQYRETGPYGPDKVARYYLAETHQKTIDLPINPEIGKPEHEEYVWATYDEALKLVSARVRSVLEWSRSILKYVDFED